MEFESLEAEKGRERRRNYGSTQGAGENEGLKPFEGENLIEDPRFLRGIEIGVERTLKGVAS